MNGEPEIPGYPPPTLVRRRSATTRLRLIVLFVVVAVVLGTCTLSKLMENGAQAPKQTQPEAQTGPVTVNIPESAEPPATPPPVAQPVAVAETPADGAAEQPSPDARQANRWYYVNRLGDGPGAIYSRHGGQWSYAFACAPKAHMIEFIAVGTGDPGGFQDQSIQVGQTRLAMDATYARDGGGTISVKLPASNPFFSALDGSNPMQVQLVASRQATIPVDASVVRLVKACRGG